MSDAPGFEHHRSMVHRAVAAGCGVVVICAGCGGTSPRRAATTAVPPVSVQVHDALTNALRRSPHQRFPYVAVGTCSGPAMGGPGTYRCRTTPRPRGGVREVKVVVGPDGTWSTSPMPVMAVIDGHHATAMSGLWGVVRLP